MYTTGVILAAGTGARLDRSDSPKPLVTVGGKPLIIWNIEQLQAAGVKKIFIVVGFRKEEIKKELTNHPSIHVPIEFLDQADASQTGMLGSVLMLEGRVTEPFFLTMADLVLEKNPYPLFNTMPEGKIATLVGVNKEQCLRSGAQSQVTLRGDQVVNLGREIEPYDGLEVGVYAVFPEVLSRLKTIAATLPSPANFGATLTRYAEQNALLAVRYDNTEWFDVNTPAILVRAEIFCRDQEDKVPQVRRIQPVQALSPFSTFTRSKLLQSTIYIERGIFQQLSETSILPPASLRSTRFLLTDTVIDPLYGSQVMVGLEQAGYRIRKLVIPPGEENKNIETYTQLANQIFGIGIDKRSYIISLGGGVINNIAGFLASTLYRGIGLIHFPTSMMAQVDAAIDFKQAVNASFGKNLFGSYYPASSIIIDPNILTTLPKRHLLNGISESIKHALAQDNDFLNYLFTHQEEVTHIPFLEYVVRRTIELKVPLVNGDVHNDYNEMIPQYGHSIGHAVEHLSGYHLLHGEAIAVGMCLTAEIAFLLGICDHTVVAKHYDIFEAYQLPTTVPLNIDLEDVVTMLHYDKHFLKGNPEMALVKSIGTMWHEKGTYGIPIEMTVLRRALQTNRQRVKND